MKQVFIQKGEAVVEEVGQPLLSDQAVLVRVHYSFISAGTEGASLKCTSESLLKRVMKNPAKAAAKLVGSVAMNGVKGTMALVKGRQIGPLSPIGYSCAGQAIAVGDAIKRVRVGDYVACAGAGLANHSDVVAVPENLTTVVQSKEHLRGASVTTIGSIALQGVRRADLRLGETVCVVGLGLIGQITVQLLKAAGCRVIGTDIAPDRLELAKELGADIVFDPTKVALKKEVDFLTNHHGVDATIITAAASTGDLIQHATEMTRRKGKIVLVGDVAIDFDRNPLYAKEIDFLISCSYGPGRYDPAYEQEGNDYPYAYVRWTENRNMQLVVQMIERGELLVDPLIGREFSVDEAPEAYKALKGRTYLGMVMNYKADDRLIEPAQRADTVEDGECAPYVTPEKKLGLGVVGAGGFAQVKLLPILKEMPVVEFRAVVDAVESTAINVARQYKAPLSGVSHKDIINNMSVNAVVIATPHDGHARQAIDFLRAGKAVFVEKPAGVSASDYALLERTLKQDGVMYSVDFNRSWAPYVQAIEKEVAKRSAPLVVHYRMNAGYIPMTHWVQQPKQGGRIIGEGCHILELFCFLTGATPVSISVEAIRSDREDLLPNDNASIQVRFSDGSCCTLLYTALGDKSLPKERMEVFFDGKSIVLDDFRELKGFGLPASFNAKTVSPDKGHAALLKAFVESATTPDAQPPIPYERILAATKLSLIADELARQGGGTQLFDGWPIIGSVMPETVTVEQ